MAWLMYASPVERRGELIGSALSAAIVGVLLGPVLGGAATVLSPEAVFSFVALASFWAPGMAMLSDAAEGVGLDQALAFAISNLAWALGHLFGAGVGGAVADATSDTVPYTALAVLCGATLVGLTLNRRRQETPREEALSA